ncbi:symmetrical bis(5'-nucleosyl)-tetraphosphatase [uncultured Thiodictyon sp.]|jgi:bis(5'-nucleosyl)-tetraphosphatase (symmetrical)|uniref:symmetrical bis(5'-nucleosyl)-tetraphosphatase n=1 Tax=uncultured Thiodictyon sp. TaxID=1846217 RepID=UPI0025EDDBB7|nr:symmetrical bis(5'-nucleosyl)-tetraphosphatase [uncultured Thiodictyon sp.]
MPTYAIGDIQGCELELQRLLERLKFDPAADRLWFTGDLVNRGPGSLGVLRLVHSLDACAIVVLGNHDLHLLALAAGNERHARKSTLDEVLSAPDRDELLHWLRHRPLLHHDAAKGYTLIHAGLAPQWTLSAAQTLARELEETLRGAHWQDFLLAMYGDQPERWRPDLTGIERLRFITNALTRLRYCTTDGALALKEKRPLASAPKGLVPWFQCPGRKSRDARIIFGHWSALGYWDQDNVWGIDSGCLWGGNLTAVRVRKSKPIEPVHLPCEGYLTPGESGD